jgi:hypothetical protein
MSRWFDPLPFPIVPKSGPMRRMRTLADMNRALTKDLPFRQLCQPSWQQAARLVVHAATTEMDGDIQSACEAMVESLDLEGWMTAEPATSSRGGAA